MGPAYRVAAAKAARPRVRFLPVPARAEADHDGPLSIGHGQTNSQPRTVRAMLELLDVLPGQRVLDVGSGSGWTTALLAELTGPTGRVLGLELVPDLVEFGAANLAAADLPWAEIRAAEADGLGAPEDAPFDRILVSAMATRLPLTLVDQLEPGGVLVVPVDGVMTRAVRAADGSPTMTTHGRYRFVPLVGG